MFDDIGAALGIARKGDARATAILNDFRTMKQMNDAFERAANPPVPVPKPVAISPDRELDDLERAEYLRVAQEIGLETPAMAWDKLDQLMLAKGIGLYDYRQVDEFLRSEARKAMGQGAIWTTKALRKKDVRLVFQGLSHFDLPIYTKKVPLQAISLVADIEKAIPDTFTFEVTDYEVRSPDPFLLARHKESDESRFIFHWDEPTFKIRPAGNLSGPPADSGNQAAG